MRKTLLIKQLKTTLEDVSGIEMDDVPATMSFIEIGLDSLLLTQIALLLKKEYRVPISFRQLNEDVNNLDSLAHYLDLNLPMETSVQLEPLRQKVAQEAPVASSPLTNSISQGNHSIINLMSQQIQLLAQQIAIISDGPNAIEPARVENSLPKQVPIGKPKDADQIQSADEIRDFKQPCRGIAKIEKYAAPLTTEQQQYLSRLTERYTAKTRASKAYTQEHRSYMADPRVVSGFKPLTKGLVYSIVTNRSQGSHLWDIDGNEYIDLLNGFGSSLLGYQPVTVKKAILDQIEKGFEIGPQHELAGEVSKLLGEMTGVERVALCNTGSEAVLAGIRIARVVTGKPLIVSFRGSYHGIFDEVMVHGSEKLRSLPAAPGVMPEAFENILVLDYGTDESLKIIQERAHEIAAVLVEPVQSVNPELQPIEFLKILRKITEDSGIALVFDEVITGFRIHQGGAQALFDIQADICLYGKAVGAGLSIGVVAGRRKFLDALDGGYWQYGDASIPEIGVTYFAGTFMRHPLVLAAVKALLLYMKEKGNALQESLTEKTLYLANAFNAICTELAIPLFVAHFGSIMKFKYKEEYPYSELLYVLMREKGIHIQDDSPCYMTEAHTREELDIMIKAFKASLQELIAVQLIPTVNAASSSVRASKVITKDKPPVPNARLGKDADGNPAWFVSDPDRAGKYLQIEA